MTWNDVNFNAVDFETATFSRSSICEAGICIVRSGVVAETHSWLVRPYRNLYNYMNVKIHGIRPEDTANAPDFPEVWAEMVKYILECPVLVAHNSVFDMGCIRSSLSMFGIEKPEARVFCSLRAARHLYDFGCNKLDYLCKAFDIPQRTHHRAGDDAEMCARLFLREIRDSGGGMLDMNYCMSKL